MRLIEEEVFRIYFTNTMRILKNERVLFQGGRTGHREECRRASEIRPSWLEVLLPDVI